MTMPMSAVCGAAPVTLLVHPQATRSRRARPHHTRRTTTGWWRTWLNRFGLAEACGSIGAITGFAAGYLLAGSLITAAALATAGEVIGFYGCVGTKTAVAAARATAHLTGWRRLAAAAWHAVREQLASCAVAEAVDDILIRPGCLAGAAWLLKPLPGGVWLGFAVGKAAADVAWYALEASARWGVTQSARGTSERVVSRWDPRTAAGGALRRAPKPEGSVCILGRRDGLCRGAAR
jgi:hypothetical protein